MPKNQQELMQERIELYLNELQADMQVFQMILHYLLTNSIFLRPDGKEALAQLQKDLRLSLETAANASADPRDGERMKQLSMARAERFFGPLNQRFDVPSGWPSPGKPN